MKTQEWRTIDKSGWARGPWDEEPDKVQWPDAATGLPCLAVRQPDSGHWCGYVGIGPGHPAYGREYEAVNVDVHGGLTYGDFCRQGDAAGDICHVAEPGEPDHLYWLGFDCHHSEDLAPGMEVRFAGLSLPKMPWRNTYRTLDYVRQQCAELARQLADPDLTIDESEAIRYKT